MHRGEVWWAKLGKPRGKELAYDHPAVVVQSDDLSRLDTVIIAPTTTKLYRAGQRGTVRLEAGDGGLPEDSVVLCYQLMAVDKTKLVRLLGELSPMSMAQVEATTAYVLGLAL